MGANTYTVMTTAWSLLDLAFGTTRNLPLDGAVVTVSSMEEPQNWVITLIQHGSGALVWNDTHSVIHPNRLRPFGVYVGFRTPDQV